jgi:hypothetical protein
MSIDSLLNVRTVLFVGLVWALLVDPAIRFAAAGQFDYAAVCVGVLLFTLGVFAWIRTGQRKARP